MSVRGRGILIGDYDSELHPVNGIDKAIMDILKGEIGMEIDQDYEGWTRETLTGIDLLVSYADRWQQKRAAPLVDAIVSYVGGGGGLVAIHNGIRMSTDAELVPMLGARFLGHPAYQDVQYSFRAPEHPIARGLEPWTMGEEPYQFEFDLFIEKDVFLEYAYQDQLWAAGWTINYGLGRVVYLAPGHDLRSFANPAFRKLILHSCRWAQGAI